MGVDVCVWRARIGSFVHSASPKKCKYCDHNRNNNCGDRLMASLRVSAVIFMLLVISGVELNPGPLTMAELKTALEELKTDLRKDLATFNTDLTRKIKSVEENLDTHKASCDSHRDQLQDEVTTLRAENVFLRRALEQRDEHARKNSVVIKGISEVDSEDTDDTVRGIASSLDINLGLDAIANSFRVGRQKGQRPIVCTFNSNSCKTAIMKRHKESGNRDFAIYHDLTKQQQAERRSMAAYRDLVTGKGHDAAIKYRKLVIDGKPHTLLQLKTVYGELAETSGQPNNDIVANTPSNSNTSGVRRPSSLPIPRRTSAAAGSNSSPPATTLVTTSNQSSNTQTAGTNVSPTLPAPSSGSAEMETDAPSQLYSAVTRRDECEPLQIWMMIRHGSRYPSKEVIIAMNDRLPQLKDQIIKQQNKGTLCASEIEILKKWNIQAEPHYQKQLAKEGRREMRKLAKRMMYRFPNLIEATYSNNSHKFRYTATQRAMESARSFVNGIFGQDESNKVWYPEALTKYPILRFYKLCEKWLTEVDDTPASQQEKLSFEASEPFQTVLRDVAARLGLSEISTDDLVLMYKTCAFETSWMQNGVSPWCVIFSENHLQVLEYAQDLHYYWNDGYGFDVTHQQACPAIQDMLDTFQQADEGSSLKGTFYFTHSGTILKLLSHLGLYRDASPLLHSNFEQYRKHRQWRVGLIDSFATNIAAVLYLCGNDDDYHVLMLHQERVVNLPGCPKDKLCPLDVLRKIFPICNFDKICDLSQPRGFDEL